MFACFENFYLWRSLRRSLRPTHIHINHPPDRKPKQQKNDKNTQRGNDKPSLLQSLVRYLIRFLKSTELHNILQVCTSSEVCFWIFLSNISTLVFFFVFFHCVCCLNCLWNVRVAFSSTKISKTSRLVNVYWMQKSNFICSAMV